MAWQEGQRIQSQKTVTSAPEIIVDQTKLICLLLKNLRGKLSSMA